MGNHKHKDKEYRTKSFRDFRVKEGVDGVVVAKIATFGVEDHDGDVLVKGAVGETYCSVVFAHNHYDIPLGKAFVYEKGDDLIAEIQFNLDIDTGRKAFSHIKFDLEHGTPVQEYSWGFYIIKGEWKKENDEYYYFLLAVDIFEVSPVLRGASVGTGTISAKCTHCSAKGSGRPPKPQPQKAEKSTKASAKFFEQFKAMHGRNRG